MDKKTLEIVYYILIVVFIIVGGIRIYSWSRGTDDIAGIFTPFGFAALFASTIIGPERKPLYYPLFGIAVVLIILGLVLTVMNWLA